MQVSRKTNTAERQLAQLIVRHFDIKRYLAILLAALQVFCEIAYRSDSVQNVVDGIDEFLDEITVLPPSIWDPKTRLEPPISARSKVNRPFMLLH